MLLSVFALVVCVASRLTFANSVVQLTSGNLDEILKGNELVFVNFYADWCRFSQMLTPVFAEGSDAVAKTHPVDSGKVRFAKLDCDKETALAQRFKITKYPTLKLFRFGEPLKREYRGGRNVESFSKYINDELVLPIIKKESHADMQAVSDDSRNMLVYIEDENSVTYKNLLRAASQLRNDCKWYVVTGPEAASHKKDGDDVVYYRAPGTMDSDIPFTGLLQSDSLIEWARGICVPTVRELTFENAEELTEEGLPFLILFHRLEDTETPEIFKEQVNLQLSNDRDSVTALVADGVKFAHPLHHLGKTVDDLPLIAIDSFKHMYIFKHDVRSQLREDGLLKQFVDDLNSGKLHREFHNGPDPTQPPAKRTVQNNQGHVNRDPAPSEVPAAPRNPTQPPKSVFEKLKPSHNRYTVLKDEL